MIRGILKYQMFFRMNRFPLRRWSSFYQHHSKKSAYLVDKVPIEDHPLVKNTKNYDLPKYSENLATKL